MIRGREFGAKFFLPFRNLKGGWRGYFMDVIFEKLRKL